jgi:uncharacterized protein (DUF1778 family)
MFTVLIPSQPNAEGFFFVNSSTLDLYGILPYSRREEIFMAAPKEARIEARVSPTQKRLFERAAEIEGVTLTDFAISSMQRAARSAIEEQTRLELSERNQRAFVEALLNPPAPNKALREGAQAYSRMK